MTTRWTSALPSVITALWLCTLMLLLFPYLDFSHGLTEVHLNFYPIEWDFEVAREQAGHNEPEPHLSELTRYAQALVDRIAQNHDSPFQRFTVRVIDTEVINASATPGGYIEVNLGLLTFVKSESQLAAVLGHEIAHVRARHGTQKVSHDLFIRGAFMFCSALSGGPLMMPVTHLMGHFGGLAYSRAEERQADDLGLDYLFRAGIDPSGMALFWEAMMQLDRRSGGPSPQLFSTHPSDEQRLKFGRKKAARLSGDRRWAHDPTTFQEMQKMANGYLHLGRGRRALEKKRYVEADRNFSRAIESDPRNAEAYEGRTWLFSESHLDDLARQDIRQAIRLKPDKANYHNTLAVLLSHAGDWPNALAANREAVRLKPHSALHSALYRANLAEALGQAGDWAGAEAQAQVAIKSAPKSSSGHAYLGFARGGRGEIAAALTSLEHALSLKPDHIDAHFYKGWVLAKAGRKAEAAVAYRKALELMREERTSATDWYVRTATAALEELKR